MSEENSNLSLDVNDVGDEVVLDQRVRPFGSHHQKFVVIRHPKRPEYDVAFFGGIDLAHGRRDDADHRGDAQTQPFTRSYATSPARHDVQIEIHGPAVRDVENVLRARRRDTAALSRRLPWRTLPGMVGWPRAGRPPDRANNMMKKPSRHLRVMGVARKSVITRRMVVALTPA